MFRDYGTGQRSPKQIFMLVDRTRFECREDVSRQKLLPQVFDDHLARARFVRLLDHRLDVISLANIADHGDHFIRIVFLQPWNDDRRIESTGISKHNFLRHERSSRAGAPRRPAVDKEWLFERAGDSPPARRSPSFLNP